jgi:hypothetical protein
MQFKVYWQSTWLKRWKYCGEFMTFHQAAEHIDYLTKHLTSRSKVRFKVDTTLQSFLVMS